MLYIRANNNYVAIYGKFLAGISGRGFVYLELNQRSSGFTTERDAHRVARGDLWASGRGARLYPTHY